MQYARLKREEGGDYRLWDRLQWYFGTGRSGKWLCDPNGRGKSGGARNRAYRRIFCLALTLSLLIPSLTAFAATQLRIQISGDVYYSDVDHLTKALAKLEQTKAFIPVEETKGRIVFEGIFVDNPSAVLSLIQSIIRERFEAHEQQDGNSLNIILEKIKE